MSAGEPISNDQLWGEPPRPALRLPPGMTWRAHDAAGLGHLLPRGGLRYLCNAMPIAERFAWPVLERCPECVAVLNAPSR